MGVSVPGDGTWDAEVQVSQKILPGISKVGDTTIYPFGFFRRSVTFFEEFFYPAASLMFFFQSTG